MIAQYTDALYRVFLGVLSLLLKLALPLGICLGLVAVAVALALVLPRDNPALSRVDWRRSVGRGWGYIGLALLVASGWSVLRTVHPLARQDIQWRDSAEATANPVPDAPEAFQYQPSVAAISERTYTRTLTLPPQFVERLGSEGVGVLAPYLTDPSTENVLKMVDTFRRSGQDVVFTREVTRLDEEPLPFSSSQVKVRFKRLSGRAYDAEFEGHYTFKNASSAPINARFVFPLPQSGTIRDLVASVGGQPITEPKDATYEWSGPVNAGEQREAVVRYRVVGARTWHYDLGSRRRRVEQFRLDANPGGAVRFMRGSLQPTGSSGSGLTWELADVVTAQQVAIAFPPDIAGRDGYLQALSALPAAFVLFLLAAFGVAVRFRQAPCLGRLSGALVIFAFGLGAAAVLANYLGPIAGMLVGPLLGAFLAVRVLGRQGLYAALPAALLPATFLSPQHTGLLILLLAAAAITALFLADRPEGNGHEPPLEEDPA